MYFDSYSQLLHVLNEHMYSFLMFSVNICSKFVFVTKELPQTFKRLNMFSAQTQEPPAVRRDIPVFEGHA